jgi:hypothetical protein
MYGELPALFIDHINMNRSDNRICNLRLATNAENMRNSGICSSNKSGFKGVCFDRRSGKWRSTARHFGKQLRLGVYATPEEASSAYKNHIKKYHGDFYYES